jgi:Biotin-protein ligase, N terminal
MSGKRALRRAIVVVISLASVATAIACDAQGHKGAAPILLFIGTGTSPGDVGALETILNANHLGYATASSAELNAMAEAEIRRYRLLIVPGGDFVAMGNSLTPRTTANIRNGVQNGLNYLGICAGAFLAGHFPQPYKSLNLTSGVQFGFYAAAGRLHKTVVPIAVAGGPTLDQYWEDGPQLTGWGAVVAKYPDDTPAVVQGTVGSGAVILAGVHPEAPDSWRRGMTFGTPSSTDNAFAATLIQAALNKILLSHF